MFQHSKLYLRSSELNYWESKEEFGMSTVKKLYGILFPAYAVALFVLWILGFHALVWMGVVIPMIVIFSYLGSIMAFRPKRVVTNPTKKERIIIASIFLGVAITLLILTILMILKIITFPGFEDFNIEW